MGIIIGILALIIPGWLAYLYRQRRERKDMDQMCESAKRHYAWQQYQQEHAQHLAQQNSAPQKPKVWYVDEMGNVTDCLSEGNCNDSSEQSIAK